MKDFRKYIFFGINSFILYGVILFLFSIFKVFNIQSIKHIFVLSVLVTCVFKYLLYKNYYNDFDTKKIIILELGYVLVFFAVIGISSYIYDTSYDGRAYHQEGIIQLVDGYNPFFQQLDEVKVRSGIWINHYPKASEIVSAVLYSFTGNIESGKGFNILFTISNVFIGMGVFLRWKKEFFFIAIIASVFLSFNPVSIYQSFTYYVDGQMASLLLATIFLMIMFLIERKQIWNILLIPIIFSLANIKFTSLIYLIFVFGVYYLVQLIKLAKKQFFSSLIITSFSILIAVFFIGFNPYVTNTEINGHPFYPLYGKQKIDIMTVNSPVEFANKNRFQKFYLSFLGKSSNFIAESNEKVKLKVPFTFSKSEFNMIPDIRIAGFGPFFSGILLTSFILYLFYINKKNNVSYFKSDLIWIDFIILVLTISIIIHPEFWWARYVPQLWIIPMLMILRVYCTKGKMKLGLLYIPIFFYSLTILAVVLTHVATNLLQTSIINYEIKTLIESNQKIEIYFDNFDSDRLKLLNKKIEYISKTNVKDLRGAYENKLFLHETIRHNDKNLFNKLNNNSIKNRIKEFFKLK